MIAALLVTICIYAFTPILVYTIVPIVPLLLLTNYFSISTFRSMIQNEIFNILPISCLCQLQEFHTLNIYPVLTVFYSILLVLLINYLAFLTFCNIEHYEHCRICISCILVNCNNLSITIMLFLAC